MSTNTQAPELPLARIGAWGPVYTVDPDTCYPPVAETVEANGQPHTFHIWSPGECDEGYTLATLNRTAVDGWTVSLTSVDGKQADVLWDGRLDGEYLMGEPGIAVGIDEIAHIYIY